MRHSLPARIDTLSDFGAICLLCSGGAAYNVVDADGDVEVAYASDDEASLASAEQDNNSEGAHSAVDFDPPEQDDEWGDGSQAAAEEEVQGVHVGGPLGEEVLGGRGQLVFASADHREFHIALSRCGETDDFGLRQTRFWFAALRWVQFAGGNVVVGWCSHPGCAHHDSHVQPVYEGSDYPTAAAANFTEGQTLICEKATAVLAAWGGEAALQQQLGVFPPSSDEGTVTVHFNPISSQQAQAVRAGPGFAAWGVLLQHRSHPGWFCTGTDSHCRSHVHSCRHIKAANADENRPCATLGAEAFRRKLAKDFDFDSGKRSHRKKQSSKPSEHTCSALSSSACVAHS